MSLVQCEFALTRVRFSGNKTEKEKEVQQEKQMIGEKNDEEKHGEIEEMAGDTEEKRRCEKDEERRGKENSENKASARLRDFAVAF